MYNAHDGKLNILQVPNLISAISTKFLSVLIGKGEYLMKESKIIWKDKGPVAKNNNSVRWFRARQVVWWNLTSESVFCGPTHSIGGVTWELVRNIQSQTPTPDQLNQNLF